MDELRGRIERGHVVRTHRARNAQETGGPSHALSADPDGGTIYPWEGEVGGTNTGNGNKLTRIPLVSWTARGGLGVDFSLYHNSQRTHNSELGHKWTHSYDQYLVVDEFTGDVIVHHGDDLAYGFIRNIDGTYSAPTGIYDTLVANGNPITSYDLTTKHGIKTRFTSPNGPVSYGYDSSSRRTSVTVTGQGTWSTVYDPGGRVISTTNPYSESTSWIYNAANLPTQQTFSSGAFTTFG